MTKTPMGRKEIIGPQIARIGSQLESIPLGARGEINSNPVPWIFTNDAGFKEILPGIEHALSLQKVGDKPRVALLSGVGSFATMAGLLPDIDCFVSADLTSAIFPPIQRSLDAIHKSFGPNGYINQYDARHYFAELQALGVDPTPYWNIERTSFGERHFLASAENFTKSKKVLDSKPFLFTQGNFVHKPYVEALALAMKGGEIPYASFTDLAEWYPEFLDLVAQLPFTEDSVIVWSTNHGQKEAQPVAQYSVGVENYIKEARAALEGTHVSYHRQYLEKDK